MPKPVPPSERVPDHLFAAASTALYDAREAGRSMDQAAADVVRAVLELLEARKSPEQPSAQHYVGRITVHDLDDPPRRLMEEALEKMLAEREEPSSVSIEFVELASWEQ